MRGSRGVGFYGMGCSCAFCKFRLWIVLIGVEPLNVAHRSIFRLHLNSNRGSKAILARSLDVFNNSEFVGYVFILLSFV